ncbi:hypothetical protein NMYAN_60091 [Nitrosomonas nitrosa]|uniref:Uncharacterized protein n=1 Tax=Nitrosomonas nitrosa TaxID=52442 RepID=A0A8H9DB82_9PROT|nr:hypothetical protein NMYAN_60091 [Nitrosomonas nitrosa]
MNDLREIYEPIPKATPNEILE